MWKSSSYEVVGRGHAKMGLPCQDKTLGLEFDGATVIALADGAGSAKASDVGAAIATETATQFVAQNFEALYIETDGQLVKFQICEAVLSKLEAASKEMACKLSDLASTLLLAAVKDDRFLMVHIGDGVIGCLKGSEMVVASKPHNGEFANETVFTTSAGSIDVMKIIKGEIGQINGFVLMSDGSATSLYNSRTQQFAATVAQIVKKNIASSNENMTKMIRHLFDEFIVKRTTDDCSIIVLSK